MHQSVVPPTPTLVNEREWAGSAGSIPRRSVRGVLRRAFLSLWRVGWEPLDVAHVGARQLPKELRSLLPVALELDLVAQRSRFVRSVRLSPTPSGSTSRGRPSWMGRTNVLSSAPLPSGFVSDSAKAPGRRGSTPRRPLVVRSCRLWRRVLKPSMACAARCSQ